MGFSITVDVYQTLLAKGSWIFTTMEYLSAQLHNNFGQVVVLFKMSCVTMIWQTPVFNHQNATKVTLLTPDAAECIEIENICKPSIYTSELQNRLVLDGVLHPADLPHPSTITKFVRNELLMTKKKIHTVPSESRTAEIEARTNFFLDQVSDLVVSTIHFFDEASVTKTTMNRRYGNSIIGTPAFEIQRSASNATFTINLLHSGSRFCKYTRRRFQR